MKKFCLFLFLAGAAVVVLAAPNEDGLERLKRSSRMQHHRYFKRTLPSKVAVNEVNEAADVLDPNLEGMSTAELYRMIKLLDILEKSKDTAAISPQDLKTLEYLMTAYQK